MLLPIGNTKWKFFGHGLAHPGYSTCRQDTVSTDAEVAVVLGFHEHDIAQLVVAKMLIPLGKPAHNSPKHFATVDIIKVAQNREWLSIATRQISRYWQSRNEKKRIPPAQEKIP